MTTPIKQSAYTNTTTPPTVMSTELNSLAAGATAISTTVIDNTANLDIWTDVELSVTFAVAPVAGSTVDLYLIKSIDGTLYEDASNSIVPTQASRVGAFEMRNVATLQVKIVSNVQLTPGKQKFLVINSTAQALTASGHTLRHNAHSMASG